MKITEDNEKILKQKITELFSLEIGISISTVGSYYPNQRGYIEWEKIFEKLEDALNYFTGKL